MPVNIDSVEGYGQQPRLADVQSTDIIPWERGGNPASVLVQTLAEFLATSIAAGARIDFGASPAGLTPSVGDVFFDTDDGIVYQYELTGWTAKLDLVSSAELASAIANFLTQTAADARYPLKTATDPYPTYLTQTEAAALFSPIGGDAQGGLRYNFVTTTGTATTGQIRFNNAALASVTAISIHESDRNSAAQSEILDVLAVGTRIQVSLEDNEEIYAWFRVSGAVVDNGSDRTIPVAFVSSAGTFVAGEVTINFLQIQGSGGGGATGLKFTLNTAAGTPAVGEIRSTNLAAGGTIAVNPTDTQANASDILARLGVGAIVSLAKDGANWVRGTITTAYTVGTGSFAIGSVVSFGAIANTETVYLSIASDAPSSGGSANTVVTIAYSGTIAPNLNLANVFLLDATGNFTLNAPLNSAIGKEWELYVTQDATGSRTITIPASSSYEPEGGSLVLTTTANKYDIIRFRHFANHADNTTPRISAYFAAKNLQKGTPPVPDPLAGFFTSFWKLDESSGNAADAIGTNTLTPFNSPTYGAGKIGNALYANNASAATNAKCLEIDNNASFALGVDVPVYITCAVYFSGVAGFQMPYSKYDADGAVLEKEWYFVLDAGVLKFGAYDTTLNQTSLVNSTISPVINTWYILQGWFDPVANTTNIQVNAETPVSASVAANFSIRSSAAKVRVGCGYTVRQYGANARIDCVGFAKTVPSAAQRTAVYNSGNAYQP